MKINIAVMMCAALGLPGVIFGQHHAPPATPTAEQSITGDWVIHFQAGHESVSGSLHLQADGERLAGTVETGHTGPGTVENGKWSKQKLEATLVFKKHESVVLEGELKSNGTLAGNYTTEGRTETWQAERKSATAYSSGFAGTPQMLGDTASGTQVLHVFEQWTSAYEKGDLDGSMSIFAPNVVFAFQGSKDQDYEGLRKGYVQDFATRGPGTVWVPRIEEVYVEGTVAIVRSVWELKVKSGSAETEVKARNRSVDILSKGSGSWRIIRSFNYPEK